MLSCSFMGAQLQVTKNACLGDDGIIGEPVLNQFLVSTNAVPVLLQKRFHHP